MKVQISSVNPEWSLKPWVPNVFSVFYIPCAEGCTLWEWLWQEFDYSSHEKFQGFPNLLFVTKLSRIKEFFFFCEKRRKQSKRKQKSTCSDFDGCLESFEYTNFKSLEKFHKPFCKWKEHMLKKPKRADATSKESVYIPTFSQNKAVCPFKEHFPKKILLQNKELMPGSSLFPPVFWFA